jgi:hypothetical protein
MSLRSAGKTEATKFHSEVLVTTPTSTVRVWKTWAAHAENGLVPFASEEALPSFTKDQVTKINI